MARAFKWLPYQDNCCYCLFDLRSAVLCIAIYAGFCAYIASTHIISPICLNIHGPKGFGLFIYIVEGLTCLTGVTMFVATVVMGFTTVINKPIIKPYVLSVFCVILMEILLALLYFIKIGMEKFKCARGRVFIGYYQYTQMHAAVPVLNLFTTVLSGAFLVYYNIVVNSFAKQWDEYNGNIPVRPDNVPIQPLPHIGQPWKPYNNTTPRQNTQP
ncbi:hypothetical protein O0L34_g1058 [Tuta absoluta]|nr:hypothetical protein O0L34_g1058 [Tuta absoluta]